MQFLGLVGYYHAFCKKISTIVAPLTDLPEIRAKSIWSDHKNVKTLSCAALVLAALGLEELLKLQVDAHYVGAVSATFARSLTCTDLITCQLRRRH